MLVQEQVCRLVHGRASGLGAGVGFWRVEACVEGSLAWMGGLTWAGLLQLELEVTMHGSWMKQLVHRRVTGMERKAGARGCRPWLLHGEG